MADVTKNASDMCQSHSVEEATDEAEQKLALDNRNLNE